MSSVNRLSKFTNKSVVLVILGVLVIGLSPGCGQNSSHSKEFEGIYLGMSMIGGSLREGGDDVGPANEVQRMILADSPIVNYTGLVGYHWPTCQPNDPGDGPKVYDWSSGDAIAAKRIPGKARSSYFQIYGSTPSWLTLDTPRYWQKFEEFVEAMTIHINENFGEVDYIFENEPNSSRQPESFQGNWADWYMHCLKHFYPAVHRASAKTGMQNRVIAGNLAGQCAGLFEDLYQRGLKDYSDVLGYHAYPRDIRTGVEVADLARIREIQNRYGDSEKKIYVCEGWGSGRSAGFDRSSPKIEPSAEEIENMWLAMTVGWDNFMTPRENWDPKYLYGAIFFCGNDNWGARNWRKRAEVRKDSSGNVTGFVVDGYPMTPDIAPQFWNGGMMDWYGNSKDCLIHVFPGNGLALMNPGFEITSSPPRELLPHFWTPISDVGCSVDGTVFRSGSRSLKLTRAHPGIIGFRQMSPKRSVVPGVRYRVGVWCNTPDASASKPRLAIRFCSMDGGKKSDEFSASQTDAKGWRRIVVEAEALPFASRMEVCVSIEGAGTAWFDDVTVAPADVPESGTIRGYTLDENQVPVASCVVRTTTGGYQAISDSNGYYEIRDVPVGTYDLVCRKAGYVPHRVKNQTVSAGKLTFVSFNMGFSKPGLVVEPLATDRTAIAVDKGLVNVAILVANKSSFPVDISEVGIFVEQGGKDVTGEFIVVPSSFNPKTISANSRERFKFMLKPLSSAVGRSFIVNAYAFGQENRPNLLVNGTFDMGADHPHWSWDNSGKATWSLDSAEFRSSPASLRLDITGRMDSEFIWAGNYSAWGPNASPAKPKRNYVLGAYHKDKTQGNVTLLLFIEEYYFDGKNHFYNGRRFSAVPHRDVWTNDYFIYETGDLTITPGLYSTNRLKVSVGAWTRDHEVSSTSWWDDLYLKEEGDWLADDRADTGVRLVVTSPVKSRRLAR